MHDVCDSCCCLFIYQSGCLFVLVFELVCQYSHLLTCYLFLCLSGSLLSSFLFASCLCNVFPFCLSSCQSCVCVSGSVLSSFFVC